MLTVKKDGCLAWMVCAGAFITQVATIGIDNSFGVVIGSLIELLDSNTSNVSWIHSVHSTFMFLFASISSIMLKKFGFRCVIIIGAILCISSYLASAFLPNYIGLFIFYGVIGGAGSGLLFTPANIACVYYFDKWKAIATGLSMSGVGFGTMGVSLLCNYINITYGCMGYFITLCLITSLTMIFAIFASTVKDENKDDNEDEQVPPSIKITPPDLKLQEDVEPALAQICRRSSIDYGPKLAAHIESREGRRRSIALDAHINTLEEYKTELKSTEDSNNKVKSILMLLKDKRMLCYCMVHVMYELAYYVPMVYLPELMMKDHDISKEWAGTILSVLGLCNMVGKVLTGLLLQCAKISPTILSAISIGGIGICCIGFTFCSIYEHFVILTAVYGLILSSVDLFTPLILIEIFGDEKLKETFGLVMIGKMFSPIWGPPIGGALKDWTGKYNFAFYAAGTFQLIASFFNILMCAFHLKQNM